MAGRTDKAKAILYALSVAFLAVSLAMLALLSSMGAFSAAGEADEGGGQHATEQKAQVQGEETEESASADGDDPASEADEAESSEDEHAHQWKVSESVRHVDEVSHVETVTVPGATTYTYMIECDACGYRCSSTEELAAHYQSYPDHAHRGYTTGVPVATGKEPDTTESRTVVDEPARDEVVRVKTCSVCGLVEEEVESL